MILALGSPHGDDRAAWQVLESLRSDPTFAGKCVPIASPWDAVSCLGRGGAVFIVDACKSGAAAGTIHRWQAEELPSVSSSSSTSHGGSLAESFRLARSLGYDLSEVVVYGIEVAATDRGTSLSPTVRDAAERLARVLRDASTRPEEESQSVAR